MQLLYHPNEFLEREVKDVNLEDPGFDPKELKEQMIDFMLQHNGVGLAANQIGLDAKVFVFGDSKENSTICFNPTILQYTKDTTVDVEGCLSFPNMYVKVKRPKEILAKWYDENFEEQVVKIEGYSAKVYLHEFDHLIGVTIKDRVSKLKWDMATRRSHKLEKSFAA